MRVVIVMFVAMLGCKSDTEKLCFDGALEAPHRVSACGELCDGGNGKACATQADIADKRCFKASHDETCRWMCLYAKTGQDLYCAEYEKITGKKVD